MKAFKWTAAAFAVALIAAPIVSAQTTPPVPQPPQTQEAAPPPQAPPQTPADTSIAGSNTAAPAAPSHTCQTRNQVGEACACRSAPDQVGTVEAAPDGGRNVCVVSTPTPAQ